MVAAARQTAALTETRVEWHIGDLADLAFLRADSIDLVFSAFAFEEVEDLGRALRQIHRVLRVNASLVFSITHPFARITQRDGDDTLLPASPTVTRSYNGGQPMMIDVDGEPIRVWPRTISEIFTTLARAGFRTDIFLEPTPTPTPGTVAIPELLVWRARKEGS
jgi:SAM-dependent methyltransferase